MTYTALTSPRIDADGVLRFHEGDTFEFPLTLSLTDGEEAVDIGPEDTVTIRFLTEDLRLTVRELSFHQVQDNTVTVVFDRELSGQFRPMRAIGSGYRFEIRYNDQLVASDGRIEVEG